VFLAALLAFYLFVVRQPSTTTPTSNPSPLAGPVVRIKSADVTALAIKGKDKANNDRVMTVARVGTGSWTYAICLPDQADCPPGPADPTRAASLVDNVVTLRPSQTIFGAPEGLAAYGLDHPTTAEIDITVSGGRTTVIWVGAKSPDKNSYYIKLKDGTDVFLVPASAIDSTILDAVTNPPKPQPSPLPVPTPSPSPIVGPVTSPSP
jgi:hypothetical protein